MRTPRSMHASGVASAATRQRTRRNTMALLFLLHVLAACLLASETRRLVAAAPITCQPLRAFPGAADFPTYHIMGHVSNGTSSHHVGLGREAINDCSGIIEYRGVYHVFHQWCVAVSHPPATTCTDLDGLAVASRPRAWLTELRLNLFAVEGLV
jgi:hypothetical protein